MKKVTKALLGSISLTLILNSTLMARETIATMEIKLANLAIDISKHKVSLCQREEKLNELRLRALTVVENKEAINIKLAEVETALTSDKLLLYKRAMKLQEMRVALLQEKNK